MERSVELLVSPQLISRRMPRVWLEEVLSEEVGVVCLLVEVCAVVEGVLSLSCSDTPSLGWREVLVFFLNCIAVQISIALSIVLGGILSVD